MSLTVYPVDRLYSFLIHFLQQLEPNNTPLCHLSDSANDVISFTALMVDGIKYTIIRIRSHPVTPTGRIQTSQVPPQITALVKKETLAYTAYSES